jgi:hypothetical protein
MTAEANKLAHALALRAAIQVLKDSTLGVEFNEEHWCDIDTEEDGIALGVLLKDELRYLKLRNAIQWHPVKPNLFRILEVPA